MTTIESIEANDLVFECALDGPVDGPAVLLLHGFPEDRTSWDRIATALAAAGYRTIAPDQRGYSPGARPEGVSAYRLGNMVADAIGILDALDVDTAHVIGHDWGGAVAWAIAATHPDRVRSLSVLSTPYPSAITRVALSSTQLLKSWYMGMFQVPYAAEWLLTPQRRGWRAIMRGLPQEAKARYSANASVPGALTAMMNWYRALPLDAARPSVAWHRISVPTLYVWGREDPALGEAAALATADYVKGPYTFVALPGQGHWLPELAADEVVPLLTGHLATYR
jgi:pimeloyl-ACP methyl ester carboxylesterase